MDHDCQDHCKPETVIAPPQPPVTLPAAPVRQRRETFKYYLLSFLACFGIYASSSVCPFCGKPGCPVGVGGAAIVGGFGTALWHYGSRVWRHLSGWCRRPAASRTKVPHVAGQD